VRIKRKETGTTVLKNRKAEAGEKLLGEVSSKC
jgi:hypothetical protein